MLTPDAQQMSQLFKVAQKLNTFLNKEKRSDCLPSPFMYTLVKLFLKFGTALLIGVLDLQKIIVPYLL